MVGLAATHRGADRDSDVSLQFTPAAPLWPSTLVDRSDKHTLRLLLWIMPSVTWVLGLAMLQGLSYGLFLVSAVAYVNDLAPDALKSTAQGLMVSVMSLANLTAGLAGGWLLDNGAGRASSPA